MQKHGKLIVGLVPAVLATALYNKLLPPCTTITRHRLLFRLQLTADGNMKLVRLKMKRPEGDVSLSDGELFMVRRAPYGEHLAHAPPRQPVSSYRNIVNL